LDIEFYSCEQRLIDIAHPPGWHVGLFRLSGVASVAMATCHNIVDTADRSRLWCVFKQRRRAFYGTRCVDANLSEKWIGLDGALRWLLLLLALLLYGGLDGATGLNTLALDRLICVGIYDSTISRLLLQLLVCR